MGKRLSTRSVGAKVVFSRNADKMQKHAGSLDFNAKARIVEGT
jgi:hypothetical protein